MAKQKKYSQEFKEEAVKLVTNQGYSYSQAAKQIGVSTVSIREWVMLKCSIENPITSMVTERFTRILSMKIPELSCSKETLRKVKRDNKLFSCAKKKYRYISGDASNMFEYPRNRLNRNYTTSEINLKWCGDITQIKTKEGWLYLCAVMDLLSRKVAGWSVSADPNSAFVCQSLENVIEQRMIDGYVLFHSDRGTQFSSDETQDFLLSHGIESSMSPKGDPWSNAVQENFFQKLKYELIKGRIYGSNEEAKKELFWYIEIFYNRRRRNQYLGYLSPDEYEQKHSNVA